VAALAACLSAAATAAGAATLTALTSDERLIAIDTTTLRAAAPVRITGVEGRLLGIDVRPKDKKLYGITDADIIYTIDPGTGAATRVSKLSIPFAHGGRAVVDFNPQADRLRLLGISGISYRVNVDTGAVILDGMLKYGPNDPGAGKQPFVTAGAYTNAMPDAKGTELIDLDTAADTLALQSPPNDGVLQTRGKLSADLDSAAAFDIMLDEKDDNIGFVLSKGVLHTIDLDNGKLTRRGPVAGLPAVIDIAAWPVK